MYVKTIVFFLFFFSLSAVIKPIPESIRRTYALKLNDAFMLQSFGQSTLAFFRSKEAYEEAIQAGESARKLNAVLDLFRWYRKYGYAAGLMTRSSGCIDEHKPEMFSYEQNYSEHQLNNYESEWGKNPQQAQYVRQFILGTGMVISGVFSVTIGTPIIGKFGISLISAGFLQIFSGLNGCWTEKENRKMELERLEKQIKNSMNDG